jgi:transketolase
MVDRIQKPVTIPEGSHPGMSNQDLARMKDISWRLSRQIIQITTQAGSGHPSSSLSAIDLLTGLYFGGILRFDPLRPDWPDRDRFIMSKGHAAPGLYVTLAQAGYFDPQLLSTLRTYGSPLEGHPVMHSVGGVEASTGSLGQGLSIGLGHALAGRLDGKDFRVYVMIGDGESDEGQIWEAAMAAAKFDVDHLTAILDYNRYQQTGPVNRVMPSLAPVVDKWEAFGWKPFEIDGHDLTAIIDTYQQAREVKGRPQIIIAHTKKGKGLSPFEKDPESHKHGVTLTKEEAQIALTELDQAYGKAG